MSSVCDWQCLLKDLAASANCLQILFVNELYCMVFLSFRWLWFPFFHRYWWLACNVKFIFCAIAHNSICVHVCVAIYFTKSQDADKFSSSQAVRMVKGHTQHTPDGESFLFASIKSLHCDGRLQGMWLIGYQCLDMTGKFCGTGLELDPHLVHCMWLCTSY